MLRYGTRSLGYGSIHGGTDGLRLVFGLRFGDRGDSLVSDEKGGRVDVTGTGELCTLALTA
ncbi:MAG: hypothetical protein CL912_09210 [Deltaproteobacteria bacterium]|nr:hypothetical protein [Deltaproteobacteria bacterium]